MSPALCDAPMRGFGAFRSPALPLDDAADTVDAVDTVTGAHSTYTNTASSSSAKKTGGMHRRLA